MKKSIYFLIAPLAFLLSCSGTSEIFDDAYNEAKAPAVVKVDEKEGYADYIQHQEKFYDVEVDSSTATGKSMNGLNPSYYGQGESTHNHQQQGSNYHNGMNYGIAGGLNNWGVCEYSCMTFFRQGSCWHTRQDMAYGGWGGYNGYYNNPYDPYGYGNGYCVNSYYGNNYYGNNYGNPYYGNNYYGNSYYGGGYYGYGYGYGSPWSPWGGGILSNNINTNNWNNTNSDNTSSGNYYYGHRGGTNTGSGSRNNTSYEHTVKKPGATPNTPSTPFPAYNSVEAVNDQEFDNNPNGVQKTDPVNSNTKPTVNNGGNGQFQTAEKPEFVNTNSPREESGSFQNAKPVNSGSSTTNNTVTRPATRVTPTAKPAVNQFSAGNKPSTTRPSTTGNGSGSSRTNPNKYGNTGRTYNENNTTTIPRGNSGSTTTRPRTTNSGTNSGTRTYNPPRNTNSSGSGTYNRGGSSGSSTGSSSTRSSSSGSSNRSGTTTSGGRRK
ncbi:MAG: hypothetical protein WDZ35_02315 [Crocinitomicaceae bacterium]